MNVCVAHLQMNACVAKNFGAWTEKVGHPCGRAIPCCRKDGSKIVDSISYHLRMRKSVFHSRYYQNKISKQDGRDP